MYLIVLIPLLNLAGRRLSSQWHEAEKSGNCQLLWFGQFGKITNR
jgi:hypothetical protein